MSPLPPQELVEQCQPPDDLGLADPIEIEPLEAHASFPKGWVALRLQKSALYSHQQWRSPSKYTAVGITHARMPLPLSTKALVWLAMGEVTKRIKGDGKLLRQWTDEAGRQWFEAENSKYHMTGYVMTRGFNAWINYCGYRIDAPKMDAEVTLGNKALSTILPLSVAKAMESKEMKTASAQP